MLACYPQLNVNVDSNDEYPKATATGVAVMCGS